MNIGQRLNTLRKKGPGVCARCGQPFYLRLTAKYCSARCRWKARDEAGKRKKGK